MPARRAYQDDAGGAVQSGAWRIEARYMPRFRRAFVDSMREQFATPKLQRALAKAVAVPSIAGAVDAVMALFDTTRLAERYERLYVDLLGDQGNAELRRLGLPAEFAVVAKVVEGIPVNRWSAKWINTRTGELIVQVTKAQQKTVQAIVAKNFGKRVVRKQVALEIGQTVGLLDTEALRVSGALDLAIAEGVPATAAAAQATSLSGSLLLARGLRIARTETNMAQNQGKLDSWRFAADDGIMPAGTRKQWIAATDSERTCDICGEDDGGLDRQDVPIEDDFYSETLDEYLERPPAHPNCRCTMALIFPQGAAI